LKSFKANLGKIFTPFTTEVWVCIFLFLPILGLIMLFFEYGTPGSVYPKEIKSFSRSDNGKGEPVMEMRKIPISRKRTGVRFGRKIGYLSSKALPTPLD